MLREQGMEQPRRFRLCQSHLCVDLVNELRCCRNPLERALQCPFEHRADEVCSCRVVVLEVAETHIRRRREVTHGCVGIADAHEDTFGRIQQFSLPFGAFPRSHSLNTSTP